MTNGNIELAPSSDSRIDRIRAFATLPDGWHYGEGRGATDGAITAAIEIDALFMMGGVEEVEAFPGIDGGILLTGYRGPDTLEIRCNPFGQMDLLHETGDKVVCEQSGMTQHGIIKYVGEIGWAPTKSSDYSIQCTTASAWIDSQARRSSPDQMEAFQSSIPGVLLTTAVMSAVTLLITTAKVLVLGRFSGESIQLSYPSDTNLLVSPQRPAIHAIETSVSLRGAIERI